jgi:hypothetical protein
MAWHFEKVPTMEIATKLNWDVSAVYRIMHLNKDLPTTAQEA